jgi:glycosyltransferase involved in cell wall biosynthesis
VTSNPCLVWHSIPEFEEGVVEYPFEIAGMLSDAPVYLYSCSGTLVEDAPVEIKQFGNDGWFRSLIDRTPLAELYQNNTYATWKPPVEHDVFITRGPKPLHTVQRLSQRHVHIVDGSYRGFFFHKDAYEQFHSWSEPRKFVFGLYRHYMRTAIQGSMHTVDGLVVNSERTADLVESLYNRTADKIIYPPMTLDTYSPDRRTASGESYYLYLGIVDRHHRIFELVDAFNQLPHTLKIAGDGRALQEAEDRADENIEFCGYVTGDRKRNLLANATALVNPVNHSFGRAVIESLASGRPVITLDVGYPPYVIDDGETGILYQGGVDNLVAAIERFERDGVAAETEEMVSLSSNYRRELQAQKWREVAGLD